MTGLDDLGTGLAPFATPIAPIGVAQPLGVPEEVPIGAPPAPPPAPGAPAEPWPPQHWNLGEAELGFDEGDLAAARSEEAPATAAPPPGLAPAEAPEPGPEGAPPPPVDALSGGELPPPPPLADDGAPAPGEGEADPAAADQAELARQRDLAIRDPEAYAAENAKREYDRNKLLLDGAAAAATRDEEARQQNILAHRKAIADAQQESLRLRQEVETLSAQRVDSDGWWKSRDSGQRFFAGIAAVAGGILSATNGGRNQALDMMANEAARNMEAQRANISNRRDLLNQQVGMNQQDFSRAGQLFEMNEADRIAGYAVVEKQLLNEAQKYDPRGTMAAQMTQAAMGARAKKEAALAAQEEKLYQRSKDAQDLGLRQRAQRVSELAQRETARHNRATEREATAGDAIRPLEYFGALYGKDKLPPFPMSDKQYAEWWGTKGKISDATKTEEMALHQARTNSPEERARMFGVGGIVRKDGSPVLFRNDSVAEKFTKQKAGVDTAAALIDRMLLARRKHGWSSDLLRSDEWREMKADFAALNLTKKDLDELGVIAGPDLELIYSSLGTSDPTEVRDPTAGLERARLNMVNKLNSTLLGNDDQAVAYQPPKLAALAEFERPKQDDLQIATRPVARFATDPETRAKLIEERARAIDALKYKDPTRAELDQVQQSLIKSVRNQELTSDEALQLIEGLSNFNSYLVGSDQRSGVDDMLDAKSRAEERASQYNAVGGFPGQRRGD